MEGEIKERMEEREEKSRTGKRDRNEERWGSERRGGDREEEKRRRRRRNSLPHRSWPLLRIIGRTEFCRGSWNHQQRLIVAILGDYPTVGLLKPPN